MGVLPLYLFITLIGYFTGAFLKKKGITLAWIGMVQTAAITCLVFIMGVKIGADESIVSSLDTIGLTALIITLFTVAGSLAAVFILRKALGFDREGFLRGKASGEACEAEAKEKTTEEAPAEEKSDGSSSVMTWCIVGAVGAGIAVGYFSMPQWIVSFSGGLITAGLCVLLFFVGTDIGTEGTIADSFRKAGWRIALFPIAVIGGTLAAAALASLVLPMGVRDALCIGAGFGWYSLAPAMLAEYSVRISAVSFIHNVMRELISILIIPTVARRIGYIETISIPGAPAMDVCLPVVEKSTRGDIAVYSFISGLTLSIAVPVLLSFIMNI